MFIPEFWCGVAATLIAETLALMGAIIWIGAKKNDKS